MFKEDTLGIVYNKNKEDQQKWRILPLSDMHYNKLY